VDDTQRIVGGGPGQRGGATPEAVVAQFLAGPPRPPPDEGVLATGLNLSKLRRTRAWKEHQEALLARHTPGNPTAGPCAVEGEPQLMVTATAVRAAGAPILARNDMLGFNLDLLFEKRLPWTDTLTLEGAYYNFNKGAQGWSWYALASYLFAAKVAFGQVQPMVRWQQLTPTAGGDPIRTVDAGLNYIVDGHSTRFALALQNRNPPGGSSTSTSTRRSATVLHASWSGSRMAASCGCASSGPSSAPGRSCYDRSRSRKTTWSRRSAPRLGPLPPSSR